MRRLKIISDGSVQGTRLYDSEGNEIGPVEKIEWSIDANYWDRGATAVITFGEIAIEAQIAPASSASDRLCTAPGGRAMVIDSDRPARRD